MLWGMIGQNLSFLGLIVVFFLEGKYKFYLQLALHSTYLLSFQAAAGPLFFVLSSELFPSEVKPKLMNITMFLNWCTIITSTIIYPILQIWMNYAVFIALSLASTCTLLKIMPETSGRRFSEIERQMVI
jgi:SP family arabinose:H+ symporter-like MFS transporter